MLVSPFVPSRPFDGPPLRSQSLRAFQTQALFQVGGLVARPLLPSTGEQADFRVARHDPTWTGMQREQHAIEFLPAVLLSPDVGAGAQFQSLREGMLVLGAPPDDEAHPGGGFGIVAHPEGQAVEPDYIRRRGGVDVAVRREGQSEMRVPAAAGADDVEEALHVLGNGFGRLAGQHALEMPPGQIVLSRIEKGAGQFEAWSGEIGVADEHGAEARDGGLPVATLHGDHAVQKVQLVDVSDRPPQCLRAARRHRPPRP